LVNQNRRFAPYIRNTYGGAIVNVNKKHKDSVFTFLFSNPVLLRELYSAIEGITLPPDIPVDINTLSDVLFMNQINDISFLIDNRLVVLIEHQSTVNENIPLRLLEYIGRIYEKIIDSGKRYQKKLTKIPKPEFIVLYNGIDRYPDYTELKLSDMFKDIEGLIKTGNDRLPLELVVQVYNINHGHNSAILKRCETLNGYTIFIDKIREYQAKGKTLEESIKPVINYCIRNKVLKKFLEDNSSEVRNMIFGDGKWDHKRHMAVAKEEAREEGLAEGRAEGLEKGRKEGLTEGRKEVLELFEQGLSIKEVKERLKQKQENKKSLVKKTRRKPQKTRGKAL
jgi:hypothetical protein